MSETILAPFFLFTIAIFDWFDHSFFHGFWVDIILEIFYEKFSLQSNFLSLLTDSLFIKFYPWNQTNYCALSNKIIANEPKKKKTNNEKRRKKTQSSGKSFFFELILFIHSKTVKFPSTKFHFHFLLLLLPDLATLIHHHNHHGHICHQVSIILFEWKEKQKMFSFNIEFIIININKLNGHFKRKCICILAINTKKKSFIFFCK